MRTKPLQILEYVAREGAIPFRRWFDDLPDSAAQGAILTRLGRLRLGNPGDSRRLRGGVHELRIHVGPGYRVYFGITSADKAVLLLGGSKRSQSKDIKRAILYFEDFLIRLKDEKKNLN